MSSPDPLATGGACAPGIYPRSESLVQATRDLARGRASAGDVERERLRDRERLLAVQRESGIRPATAGMLDWADLFRPLVEASEGLAVGPLVRFLDGNTFYRAVEVDGRPRLVSPVPGPGLPEAWLGTLPSPLALAHAARHAASATVFAEALLAPQIRAWAAAGCGLVVLSDPFVLREPERVDELLAALAHVPRPVSVALQLPFGDASPLLPALAGATVDALGIDLRATPVESVPDGFPLPLLAGVVDAAGSLLEDPRELLAAALALRRRSTGPVVLTPNGDLEHVPEAIAHEKLRRLGAAAAALRDAS